VLTTPPLARSRPNYTHPNYKGKLIFLVGVLKQK
jgi:hypothetical protein